MTTTWRRVSSKLFKREERIGGLTAIGAVSPTDGRRWSAIVTLAGERALDEVADTAGEAMAACGALLDAMALYGAARRAAEVLRRATEGRSDLFDIGGLSAERIAEGGPEFAREIVELAELVEAGR